MEELELELLSALAVEVSELLSEASARVLAWEWLVAWMVRLELTGPLRRETPKRQGERRLWKKMWQPGWLWTIARCSFRLRAE